MLWGKSANEPDGLVLCDENPLEETVSGEDALCAWCLKDQGIVPLSGSHGICDLHRDQFYQSYQATRGTRRGRR